MGGTAFADELLDMKIAAVTARGYLPTGDKPKVMAGCEAQSQSFAWNVSS